MNSLIIAQEQLIEAQQEIIRLRDILIKKNQEIRFLKLENNDLRRKETNRILNLP